MHRLIHSPYTKPHQMCLFRILVSNGARMSGGVGFSLDLPHNLEMHPPLIALQLLSAWASWLRNRIMYGNTRAEFPVPENDSDFFSSVSRACRLKKKAQHEANKIKLWGLNQEYGWYLGLDILLLNYLNISLITLFTACFLCLQHIIFHILHQNRLLLLDLKGITWNDHVTALHSERHVGRKKQIPVILSSGISYFAFFKVYCCNQIFQFRSAAPAAISHLPWED